MQDTVRITDFGRARFESRLEGDTAPLEDVLKAHDIERDGRRIAINGQPAAAGALVHPGDEVTIVPRVQGG